MKFDGCDEKNWWSSAAKSCGSIQRPFPTQMKLDTLGGHGRCSKSCDGGVQQRNVQCWDANLDAAATDVSNCDTAGTKPETSRKCNTRACITYAWNIGPWSSCSKTCGGGILTRTVACEASDGSTSHNEASCGDAKDKPSTATACNTAKCDPCAGETCSGHGNCAGAGICTCDTGYQGLRCATPVACDGVLDKDGKCCNGVLLDGGTCCPGASATVAADGTCCSSGTLDVCGVCNGPAVVVDVLGTCCAGQLGEDGLCCPDAVFDTCGVCNGDGLSCAGCLDPEACNFFPSAQHQPEGVCIYDDVCVFTDSKSLAT